MPVEDRYAGSLTLLAVPTTSQTHEGIIADINNGCSTFLIRNGEKAIQATDTHMQLAADDVTYSNAANYWQFEKVTKFSVNITDAKYATVGFPFSVKITTPNVAIYYAKEAANGVLKLTQASDNVIPANQGAILYCATGPTTVDVELTEETGNFVNNQLTATTAERVGFATLTTYGLARIVREWFVLERINLPMCLQTRLILMPVIILKIQVQPSNYSLALTMW